MNNLKIRLLLEQLKNHLLVAEMQLDKHKSYKEVVFKKRCIERCEERLVMVRGKIKDIEEELSK